MSNPKNHGFWKFAYKFYPPFLRLMERIKVHGDRQPFLIGKINPKHSPEKLKSHLEGLGYESAILAWKDPGELLSMRKLHEKIFQFHVRLFDDGEIRAHFEYSSEGNPWGHVTEKVFEHRHEYFSEVLRDFLHEAGASRRINDQISL